jgi:hypothetical protein
VTLSAYDIQQHDLTRLQASTGRRRRYAYLTDRAAARLAPYRPVTVADRFEAFRRFGYTPQGLFYPDDAEATALIRARLRALGTVTPLDHRFAQYGALQRETAELAALGVPGHWTGQQAWARSAKRFRLVAVSRRGGKTFHSSREGAAVMLLRPRALVWIVAETMDTVDRCFKMMVQLFTDLGAAFLVKRDQDHEKVFTIENGSTVKGVSLHEGTVNAGDAVDFAIIDEAVYVDGEDVRSTIMPPLTDRGGQMLVISSYKGQENYFYEQAQQGADEDWDMFEDVSYEINFAVFPEGRRTPTIQAAERASAEDPEAFLEEFGGIARGTRYAIYPQYLDPVHLDRVPHQTGVPVLLGIDPSSGANAYAVIAAQIYDNEVHFIDEFYEKGALAEDAMATLRSKPYADDILEGVCDSAQPSEIKRWRDGGFDILAIEKPRVEARIPVFRKLLRDPYLFYPLLQQLIAEVLEERGDARDWDELPPREQRIVILEVHGKLAPARLTPPLIDQLRATARVHIDRDHCGNFAKELKAYAYRKPPKGATKVAEVPRKVADHLVDAAGYLTWHYMRFAFDPRERRLTQSYLHVVGYEVEDEDDEDQLPTGIRISREAIKAGAEIGALPVSLPYLGPSWLEIQRGLNGSAGVRAEPATILRRA